MFYSISLLELSALSKEEITALYALFPRIALRRPKPGQVRQVLRIAECFQKELVNIWILWEPDFESDKAQVVLSNMESGSVH